MLLRWKFYCFPFYMFDVGRCVGKFLLFPAALHSFPFKLLESLQEKGQRHRCALIRWKLIAVNSLNQIWQGFEPCKETLRSWKKICSFKCFVPQCLDALLRSWHAGGLQCLDTRCVAGMCPNVLRHSVGLALSNLVGRTLTHWWQCMDTVVCSLLAT